MLRKINNESVTILSAVASGLVVDALYPSLTTLMFSIGERTKQISVNDRQLNQYIDVDIIIAIINILLIFLLFLCIWKLCASLIPNYIRFYENRKKMRYVPKTSSEKITAFYKIFVDVTKYKWECNSITSIADPKYYISLNKTLDLCSRLIITITKCKTPIIVDPSIIRSKQQNQNFSNFRRYINIYELIGTIDILLDNLDKLLNITIVHQNQHMNADFIISDINKSIEMLKELKQKL